MTRHKGCLEMYVTAEVRDKTGKLVTRKRFKSYSFVANLIRVLRKLMEGGVGSTSGVARYSCFTGTEPVDITGASKGVLTAYSWGTPPTYCWVFRANAGAGDVSHGIRVGTGSSTPTPTQFVLDAPIGHGVGGGQLSHQNCVIYATQIVDNVTSFQIMRTFVNDSGGDILVKEFAIYVLISPFDTGDATLMICRDVDVDGVLVTAGATLTVRYTLKVTT